jgi:hypothetical protein
MIAWQIAPENQDRPDLEDARHSAPRLHLATTTKLAQWRCSFPTACRLVVGPGHERIPDRGQGRHGIETPNQSFQASPRYWANPP